MNELHTVVETDMGETIIITADDVTTPLDSAEKKITLDELLALPTKFGRNDLCPCGSGKKLKNCHRQLIQSVRALQVHQAEVKRREKKK